MKKAARSLCLWLGLWAAILAGLTAQACLDLRALGQALDREAAALVHSEAEMLRMNMQLALAEAGNGAVLDEIAARPVVLETLEKRPQLQAAAVSVPDRILEAQCREPDGTLAPMTRWPEFSVYQASAELEGGRVWVALNMRPYHSREARFRRDACANLAGCAALSGLLMLALGLFLGRNRES